MAVRGLGDPVTTRETLTLEDSEYLPDESTVRHAVARNAEGPIEWTTESVAAYLHRECVKSGAKAVLPAIEDRVGSTVESVGTRALFDDETDSVGKVVVDYTVWKNAWEPTRKDAPNIDFDGLVAVTPRTVQTTVELVSEEWSCDLPVFARTTEAAYL